MCVPLHGVVLARRHGWPERPHMLGFAAAGRLCQRQLVGSHGGLCIDLCRLVWVAFGLGDALCESSAKLTACIDCIISMHIILSLAYVLCIGAATD